MWSLWLGMLKEQNTWSGKSMKNEIWYVVVVVYCKITKIPSSEGP